MAKGKRSTRRDDRTPPAAPPWFVNGVNLNGYAGALIDFREWCVRRGLEFRYGVMQAVSEFQQRHQGKK